jgi:hypothetical protein
VLPMKQNWTSNASVVLLICGADVVDTHSIMIDSHSKQETRRENENRSRQCFLLLAQDGALHLSRHPNYSVKALAQAVIRKRGLEENDTLILLKRNRFDIGKKRGG